MSVEERQVIAKPADKAMRELTMAEALNEALLEEMERDSTIPS